MLIRSDRSSCTYDALVCNGISCITAMLRMTRWWSTPFDDDAYDVDNKNLSMCHKIDFTRLSFNREAWKRNSNWLHGQYSNFWQNIVSNGYWNCTTLFHFIVSLKLQRMKKLVFFVLYITFHLSELCKERYTRFESWHLKGRSKLCLRQRVFWPEALDLTWARCVLGVQGPKA